MDATCRKDAEGSPTRRQPNSTWQKDCLTGDDACGASELSTQAMSSPGISSEADDSGGLVAMTVSGRGGSGTAASGSAPPSPEKSSGSQIAAVSEGADQKPISDPQTVAVLTNLRKLMATKEAWRTGQPIQQADRSSPLDASEAASAATAADRAAGGGGLPVRASASPTSLASSFGNTPGLLQDLEGDRLSFERAAAGTENERAIADRLQQCDVREAFCERQVAAEQSRVVLLRLELEAARRDLESRDQEIKHAEELKQREVKLAARTQCLESIHEDARREIETLRLQRHIAEVDLACGRSELAAVATRQKVLEEELRLLKERPPKAPKPAAKKKVVAGKLLDRHDLASRSAFEAQETIVGGEQKHKEVAPINEAHQATRQLSKDKLESEKKSSWLFWGCCSPAKGGPEKLVDAAAPEPPRKPKP